MSANWLMLIPFLTFASVNCHATKNDNSVTCIKTSPSILHPKPRRYDIADLGYSYLFHGWTDVQGQGAANDYCRIVGKNSTIRLACALAGTHGQNENNYISAFDFKYGFKNTWYMKDEDGDGKDDYCRCEGESEIQQVVCTKAGHKGFYGSAAQGGKSFTFTPTVKVDCKNRQVRPEFGRSHQTSSMIRFIGSHKEFQ